MTLLEWLIVKLVVVPLVGGAVAYGIVVWLAPPKRDFATADSIPARKEGGASL
jgi:hypothetical protein